AVGTRAAKNITQYETHQKNPCEEDPMNFRDWFCLKRRESFTIDPKINRDDASFYFGRDEKIKTIKAQLRRAFVEPGVPKMIIYGSFGSGKTQTLFHVS